MAKSSSPVVSLGMPVYNSEKHIARAIESLLAQTFTDFELIISDNLSDDNTRQICENYVKKDGRIHLYYQENNTGALQNFETVFLLSKGKYFAWVGSHDLWHPTWLERLVSELDTFPSVVLAYPQTVSITNDGDLVLENVDPFETYNTGRLGRLYKACADHYRAGPMVYGLFRSKSLKTLLPFPRVTLGDKLLAIEASLYGEIKQLKEDLWFRRYVEKRESYIEILNSQIDERLFGKNIPFYASFPYISHLVILFIRYCLPSNNQKHLLYWLGFLTTIMFLEGRLPNIKEELRQLEQSLHNNPGLLRKRFSLSYYPAMLIFKMLSLVGIKLNEALSLKDFSNILAIGMMILRRERSIKLDYEDRKSRLKKKITA